MCGFMPVVLSEVIDSNGSMTSLVIRQAYILLVSTQIAAAINSHQPSFIPDTYYIAKIGGMILNIHRP